MALDTRPARDRSTAAASARGGRVRTRDRMFFTEQLSMLLETGENLTTALRAIGREAERPAVAALIADLRRQLDEGRSLSVALAHHPAVFDKTYVSLVAAAEGGGFLPRVLEELHQMDQRRETLNRALVSALSYPAFLVVFSLAVVIFVLVVVFPKFEVMFQMIADELPPTTKALMWASQVLTQHWMIIMGGTIGGLVLLVHWARSDTGGATLDRLRLRLPILRQVYGEVYMVQTFNVMSLSLGSGVGILETLRSAREVVRNRLYREAMIEVENRVQEGTGLSTAFGAMPYLPPMVRQVLATGEQAGTLPKVLARLAAYYQAELNKRLDAIARGAEPIMLLVMGLVVGLIVASLILPIFKLSRAVG